MKGESGEIGFAITECWLFVSIGPDGEEGLIATSVLGGPAVMPFVACDERRRDLLTDIADSLGVPYRVKHMVWAPF